MAAGLEALVARHPEVGLDTYASRVEAFRQSNTMIYDALEVVSWLILLFGVVNLVNTTLSNQLTRRREQAMLRTLGMTRRQLGTMIAWEGLCYALTAAGATLAIGLPVAVGVCRTVSSLSYGGTIVPYQFPPAGDGPLLGGCSSGWNSSCPGGASGGRRRTACWNGSGGGHSPDMTNAPDGDAVRARFSLWLWLGFFGLFGLGGGFSALSFSLAACTAWASASAALRRSSLRSLRSWAKNSGGPRRTPWG